MEIWILWLEAIRSLIEFLSSGLGLGLAIIAATLLLRAAALPLSWSIAYRGSIRQMKMRKLKPDLERLKERYGQAPDQYLQHMQALYKKNGLSVFDGKSLLGSLMQMPLLLGMFQVSKEIGNGVRFLWVSDLFRPDLALAILAGATTALMMFANPDLPESMRLFMIVVPSVIAVVFALKFCSALSLYWVTSNCFSALQTMAVSKVVGRRVRSGAVRI